MTDSRRFPVGKGLPGKPSTTTKACLLCKRAMVSRARFAQLGSPPDLRRHAARGYCTGCMDRIKPRPRKQLSSRRTQAAGNLIASDPLLAELIA